MKVLAVVALALSFPGYHFAATPQNIVPPQVQARKAAEKGGKWYMAENGHAVYCRGPVVMMPQADGGLQRVATFCQGDKAIVPLRD
jgi:hypothetical protein